MVQKKIVLFILFFSLNSFSAGLLCTDDTKHDSLSYRDSENQLWDITQIEFAKTPYINSYLACTKYIEQLSNKVKNRISVESFKALYPWSNRTLRVKYSRPENEGLLKKCNEVTGCKLTFFQNLFNADYLIKNKMQPHVFDAVPYCKGHFRKTDATFKTESDSWEKSNVQLTDTWSLPDQPLDKNLFEYIDTHQPEQIYLSTMIPSLAILQKLDEWLVNHPQSKATVLFAYNLAVLDDDFPKDFTFKSNRLFLMPVFQTPETPSSYHIKGGIFIKGDQITSLFYSVNLRRFREEKVADLAFISDGKDLSYSLLSKIKNTMHFQCKNIKWLQCSQQLRYNPSDKRKKQIDALFNTACADEATQSSTELKFKPSLTSGSELLSGHVVDAVNKAQKEILISSHVYGHSLVHEAIIKAKERGVKVQFLIGSEIEKKDFAEFIKKNFPLTVLDRKSGFTSHAKFIIIDDQEVIWGTGNFTKTAMKNPFDIYMRTDDVKFKDVLKKYFFRYFKP